VACAGAEDTGCAFGFVRRDPRGAVELADHGLVC